MTPFPPPPPLRRRPTPLFYAFVGALILAGVLGVAAGLARHHDSTPPATTTTTVAELTAGSTARKIIHIVWDQASTEDKASMCSAYATDPVAAMRAFVAGYEKSGPQPGTADAVDELKKILKEECP